MHASSRYFPQIISGRLNLLAVMLKLLPMQIFSKIKGNSEFPDGSTLTGDVLSHLGFFNF